MISLSEVRDILQSAFFVTVGAVTVLTYRSAKKTLLQPIRTETFKEQIKEFSLILELFIGKSEHDLRKEAGFDQLVSVNTLKMYDEFVGNFFDYKITSEDRPYFKYKNCLVTQSGMEKHFEIADQYVSKEGDSTGEKVKPDPRLRNARWNNYEFYMTHLPDEYVEIMAKLQRIMSSPLIPNECLLLLKEYRDTLFRNVGRLGELLTECAKEMPDKYPNMESIRKSDSSWIETLYLKDFESLEKVSQKIINYLREYFDVDSVISKQK